METQSPQPASGGQGNVPARTTEHRPRRWEPASLLDEMHADLSRLLAGAPFGAWPLGRSLHLPGQAPGAGMPRVDIFERGNNVVVKAELPGVKQDDIELAIEGGDLVLRAEQHEEQEVKDEHWYRMERSYGSLYRRLPLPEGVNADQVQATLADGVLEVTMPKPRAAEAQSQKIPISGSRSDK